MRMTRSLLTGLLLAAVALPLAPFAAAPVAAQPADSIIIQVDQPGAGAQVPSNVAFGGWAVDLSFPNGAGINQVAVFMDGDNTNGQFLGQAQLGGYRPDIAATFGNPAFANAGWNFDLSNLGITGQHSFTFVAVGAQGNAAATSVSPVSLVGSPYGYAPYPGYGQPPAFNYAVPPPDIYTQPAAPSYNQPTVLNPSGTNLWSGSGSTAGVPQVNLPQYAGTPNYAGWGQPATASAMPRVAAASLTVTSPGNGWQVGPSFQVTGSTSAVPYSGGVSFTLTNQAGAIIASGGLSVSGGVGQGGTFSGVVTYTPAGNGIGTLTIVETDQGATVGSTAISLPLY